MSSPEKFVILVDDDAAVLGALTFALESQGLNVLAFTSAEEMLRSGAYHRAGCLVVDQYLAGMKGLDLLAYLRRRGISLPAILITTPTKAMCERASAAGVLLIDKPLLSDALADRGPRVARLKRSAAAKPYRALKPCRGWPNLHAANGRNSESWVTNSESEARFR